MTHTPGPWNAIEANNSNLMHVETDAGNPIGGGIHIASCGLKQNKAAQANARLIAAAPELLEHLLAIASYADAPHVAPEKALGFIRDTARAAISKATAA